MLDTLRLTLNEIDQSIVALIAKRQSVVEQIGQTKRSSGLATRDYGRERQVLENARDHAEAAGVDPTLVEAVMSLLIDGSLQSQEQANIASTPQTTTQHALILGGDGKMGRWFAEFLSSQGYSISICDREEDPSRSSPHGYDSQWRDHLNRYDIIALATPIQVTAQLLAELASLKPEGLVFDLCSLKSPLRQSLRQLADAGCRVTSLHPMFGPSTRLLSGKHVIFVDVDHADATSQARALFDKTMVSRIDMSLEDHDRLVAYILGLSHAINIAFFTALRESGSDAAELARLSSTTFDAQLSIAQSVASENPYLYFEIQSLNDYRLAPLNALNDALARLQHLIKTGDEAGFVKMMESGNTYLRQRLEE